MTILIDADTLKAYVWDDEYSGESHIVWATTPGKAKALLAAEQNEEFTALRVRRLPWADQYKDIDEIPAEEFFKRGWWMYCLNCGTRVYDDEAVVFEKTNVYCTKCAKGDNKVKK